MRTSTTLPPDLASVPAARRWAVSLCLAQGLSAEVVGDVALLVSELVTNGVVHGRSELTLELVIDVGDDGRFSLHVEVADGDSRLPRIETRDAEAIGGRGLGIVTAVADDFGVRELPFGKAVWFDLVGAGAGGVERATGIEPA